MCLTLVDDGVTNADTDTLLSLTVLGCSSPWHLLTFMPDFLGSFRLCTLIKMQPIILAGGFDVIPPLPCRWKQC